MEKTFDINEYLGTWYQLACYPSWYSPPSSYNTTAHYSKGDGGETITVVNSTITNGVRHESVGSARQVSINSLRVDFPQQEAFAVAKAFGTMPIQSSVQEANYVVHKVWTSPHGGYIYAIVTDHIKSQFYLLSRYQAPSLEDYGYLMNYVTEHFDAGRIVQTPHYD